METKRDYFGQELDIGDYVITSKSMSSRGFHLGVIERITDKKIHCREVVSRYAKYPDDLSNFQCYPEQAVKMDPEMVTLKILMT